ncbi:thiamine phosphate synthase [Echinicola sediminis]
MMQNKLISTFQYITPNLAHQDDYILDIKRVCSTGVKWVQLRMKAFPKPVVLQTAFGAKEVCDHHGCQLIINDHPEIANKVKAAGVHVGKEDRKAADIRYRYGNDLIIGATANTLEDILKVEEYADYVGLGPFRFTNTKKKLSPILGLEGYKEILGQLMLQGKDIPVVGIGGIEMEDLHELSKTGLHGIAASGLLHRAENPESIIQEITKTFHYADHCQ